MSCKTIWLASALCLTACHDGTLLHPRPPDPGKAWVATEPIQCLGNPWEQDWLRSHGNDHASYPKDPATPGLEPEEIAIIRDYYRRLGVVVSQANAAPRFEVVCAACSCPEGHTLFLEIRRQDVEKMLALGYREEPPPNPGR